MTKRIRKIQWILAMAMTAAATANAQTTNSVTIDGLSLQTNSATKRVEVSYGQVKDDLLAGSEKFAKDATEVTEINLDPSTMGMIGHKGKDGGVASKMNFMVIHTYKYDKPGMYNMDDFQAYTKKLTDGTWNCSVHIREKNGSTDICSRTAADHETNEMVILTAQPKEITFIHMSGKMSLSDLNQMSDSSRGIKLPPSPPAPRVPVEPASPVPPVPPASSR